MLVAAPLRSLSSATGESPIGCLGSRPPRLQSRSFSPPPCPPGLAHCFARYGRSCRRVGTPSGAHSARPHLSPTPVMKSSLHELTSGKGEAHMCGMYTVTGCGLHPENSVASSVSCLAKSIVGRLASTLFRAGVGGGRGEEGRRGGWSLSTSRATISPRISVTEFWMENFSTKIKIYDCTLHSVPGESEALLHSRGAFN